MRWQRLLEDLSAQQAALERADQAAEIAERTRAEHGQVSLSHRLAADLGQPLRLRVRGVGWVEGRLVGLGSDWLLLDGGVGAVAGREALCRQDALVAVEGLSGRADTDARTHRLGIRHALRALSRDRVRVRLHDIDGEHLEGTVDRVLADHLDLSRHADDEPRRESAVRGRTSVPYATLAMVLRL
ncbi:hypothetical protein ACI3EY_08300 [Ornithinimicrobium sp. LYQ92]|uniref:hypothetical protein n=1 Tax=Serinicoccus sp. LYQ92 TaxID=3378798 RepID=UPI0038533904